MKVMLIIGGTEFLTNAKKAAEVAELLGDMVCVSHKYWETPSDEPERWKLPDYKNGTVQYCDDSQPVTHHVEITQKAVNKVFPDEAQALEWVTQQGGVTK